LTFVSTLLIYFRDFLGFVFIDFILILVDSTKTALQVNKVEINPKQPNNKINTKLIWLKNSVKKMREKNKGTNA